MMPLLLEEPRSQILIDARCHDCAVPESSLLICLLAMVAENLMAPLCRAAPMMVPGRYSSNQYWLVELFLLISTRGVLYPKR